MAIAFQKQPCILHTYISSASRCVRIISLQSLCLNYTDQGFFKYIYFNFLLNSANCTYYLACNNTYDNLANPVATSATGGFNRSNVFFGDPDDQSLQQWTLD